MDAFSCGCLKHWLWWTCPKVLCETFCWVAVSYILFFTAIIDDGCFWPHIALYHNEPLREIHCGIWPERLWSFQRKTDGKMVTIMIKCQMPLLFSSGVFFLERNWFLHDSLHTWKTFSLDPETDDGIRHLCCGDFSSAWFTSSASAKKQNKSRVIHNILQSWIRKNTVQTVRSTLPVIVQIIDAMTNSQTPHEDPSCLHVHSFRCIYLREYTQGSC